MSALDTETRDRNGTTAPQTVDLEAPTTTPAITGAGDPARKLARERRRRLARLVRRGLVAALVLGIVGAIVLALRPRPAPVDIAVARRGLLVVTVEESGMTRVKNRYVVSAPVTGTLARVPFEAGDEIAEGATLAEIAPLAAPLLDPRSRAEADARIAAALSAEGQARAMVARARAANDLADRELARMRSLAAANAVTQQAIEQAEAEARIRTQEVGSAEFAAKVAAEEVRLARAALGRITNPSWQKQHVDVLAPVSGRVLKVMRKSAGVVQAGEPIVELGDPAALEVVVDLLTTDAVHVRPGTPVEIKDWGGDPLPGRVHRIEPSAFTKPSALGVDEQRVNVVVDFLAPRQAWSTLGDGFRVEAKFELWRSDDVLQVPMGAVFRRGDGWATYRVDGGRARLVEVGLGHRGETTVEVTSGLPEGAEVAVHPGDRVKDGARVEAR